MGLRIPAETVPLVSPAQIYRVPNEWKRAPSLAAMLGAKSEEDDPAFTHSDFSERNPIFDSVFAA